MPHYMTLLAEGCEITGQIEEGLTLSDDALQIAERIGERWVAAELNRRKGQLLLRQGHSEAAEELCRKAQSIAREQEAKPWELRAAASPAGLRRDQGRRVEARDLLSPVYGWFTEGFNTPRSERSKGIARRTGVSRRVACAEIRTNGRSLAGPTIHGREPGMALKGRLPRFDLSHANGRCAAPRSRQPAVAARTQSGGKPSFGF